MHLLGKDYGMLTAVTFLRSDVLMYAWASEIQPWQQQATHRLVYYTTNGLSLSLTRYALFICVIQSDNMTWHGHELSGMGMNKDQLHWQRQQGYGTEFIINRDFKSHVTSADFASFPSRLPSIRLLSARLFPSKRFFVSYSVAHVTENPFSTRRSGANFARQPIGQATS